MLIKLTNFETKENLTLKHDFSKENITAIEFDKENNCFIINYHDLTLEEKMPVQTQNDTILIVDIDNHEIKQKTIDGCFSGAFNQDNPFADFGNSMPVDINLDKGEQIQLLQAIVNDFIRVQQ